MTVLRLLSIHNLYFYGELVDGARRAIERGDWPAHKARMLERMDAGEG